MRNASQESRDRWQRQQASDDAPGEAPGKLGSIGLVMRRNSVVT